MKDLIKLISVVGGAIAAACLPIWGFYAVWCWAMAEIGNVGEYIGAVKVIVTILMVIGGGSITIALAFWAAMLVGMLVAAILD